MRAIKKILVATDFSDAAQVGYKYAQEMAHLFDAQIDSVHIVPLLRYFHESMMTLGLPLDMEKEVYPKARKEAEEKLKAELEKNVEAKHVGKAKVLVDRKPASAIIEYADENDYDFLIIGNKGMHDSDLLRGNIAERIVRRSKVPVLSVPFDEDITKVNNIMVPLDFTKLSVQAIPYAVYMAKRLKAEISFFHVIELYESRVNEDEEHDEIEETFLNLVEMTNEALQEAEDVKITISATPNVPLEGFIKAEINGYNAEIPLHGVVRKGVNAYIEIMDYAKESADLVVMATHGSEGLTHFLLGSTTEKVVHHLNKPIVTFRPEVED